MYDITIWFEDHTRMLRSAWHLTFSQAESDKLVDDFMRKYNVIDVETVECGVYVDA